MSRGAVTRPEAELTFSAPSLTWSRHRSREGITIASRISPRLPMRLLSYGIPGFCTHPGFVLKSLQRKTLRLHTLNVT